MATSTQQGDFHIAGNLTVSGSKPETQRADLETNKLQKYLIKPTDWFVHDAIHTALTATSSADDLAVDGEAFGTAVPYITTGDVKSAVTTRRARTLFSLQPEYVNGGSVTIRAHTGMTTTVASDGPSTTIDFEVYLAGNEKVKSGSDLVTTAATTMNSLSFADKDFGVTSTGLVRGNWLDIRMTIVVTDIGTGTAVISDVGEVNVLLSIQG